VPSIGDASQGFLLGYDYSSTASARVAAKQVDEILKGAKPGDLPVEQDSTFELAINLRTAKALGLSVPSSVLLQATMLIE
jgi:putative ABC transport system substrate-binding protein